MFALFTLSIIVVVWGPLIPYGHCLLVAPAYGCLFWLSYLYLDEAREILEKAKASRLGSVVWLLSYLVPTGCILLWAHAYFGRLEPGLLRMGFFLLPIATTWLIMRFPPGTRLIEGDSAEPGINET
jgi:hypothetical protein